MQRTKGQHTVPQCYLSRFAADGKKLFVFDKFAKRVFPSSIKNVAQEGYFYDLPGKLLAEACPGEPVDPQFVEKALSRAENRFNVVLSEVLGRVERRGITTAQREEMAVYMAIQLMRTKEYREFIFEGTQKVIQALSDDLAEKNFPDLPKEHYPRAVVERDNLPAVQARHFFDEERVVKLAHILAGHVWVVGVNVSPQPYYTSDHPVARKGYAGKREGGLSGFASPGMEVAFPLTSRHLLVMLERSYFGDMRLHDGKAVVMNAYGVEHYNNLQVMRSFRQVYCQTSQFEQAEGVCRRFPEVCSPNRDRCEVSINGDLMSFLVVD
jgi:hypothetical protein